MVRMKSFDRVIAISVDRLDAVSVMYWLIQRGSFARLSARANLCCVAVSRKARWGEQNAGADVTLSANTMSPQSVFPRRTRPTHCAAFRIASKPRNSDSRMRYVSRRYSRRALRMRLSVY